MASGVRIGSSTNSSKWPPEFPGKDAFPANSCSVWKLATLPRLLVQPNPPGRIRLNRHPKTCDLRIAWLIENMPLHDTRVGVVQYQPEIGAPGDRSRKRQNRLVDLACGCRHGANHNRFRLVHTAPD
jgi:hypothetical protein